MSTFHSASFFSLYVHFFLCKHTYPALIQTLCRIFCYGFSVDKPTASWSIPYLRAHCSMWALLEQAKHSHLLKSLKINLRWHLKGMFFFFFFHRSLLLLHSFPQIHPFPKKKNKINVLCLNEDKQLQWGCNLSLNVVWVKSKAFFLQSSHKIKKLHEILSET